MAGDPCPAEVSTTVQGASTDADRVRNTYVGIPHSAAIVSGGLAGCEAVASSFKAYLVC